ncbi:MAG TPA: enoyl-CoA hydratase/isomerase family protein, partial [Acidothermaceae bacterium]
MPSERVPLDPAVAWVDLPPDGGWAALDERLRALAGQTRVVVVRAGAAQPAGSHGTAGGAPREVAARGRVIERLSSPDTVFVAVVEGPCGGAGLAIALGCDLLLAAEGAELVFSSPELFGVVASLGAAVGRVRALELCLTGRRLPAAEAASFGLVNLVVGGGGGG